MRLNYPYLNLIAIKNVDRFDKLNKFRIQNTLEMV